MASWHRGRRVSTGAGELGLLNGLAEGEGGQEFMSQGQGSEFC